MVIRGSWKRILTVGLLIFAMVGNTCTVMGETAVSGDETMDMEIEGILENMTLSEKVGQMLVPSFRVWEEGTGAEGETVSVNVTELNDEIRAYYEKYHFGGTILFGENFKDAEQTLRLTADMQAANQAGGGLPMLIGVDQEGGTIVRMKFGTSGVGNMALAASNDPGNAVTMGTIYGEELRLLGIHTDFAPVMDINNNPDNPIIGVRSFSDSPETVSAYGAAYIEGLHNAGTIVTLKHFPGHGNTDTDSHTGFPCIMSTYEELKNFELIPFQAAVDAGAEMIMTAHIQYPAIETGTYTSVSTGEQVYLPATMSHTILTDILRGDMGFEGVIISDALDMAAIADNFSLEDTLCYTINAGVNMLILPTIMNASLFNQTGQMAELAVQLAEEGKIDMSCIDDSVRRILTLKKAYGLLEETDFSVTDEQVRAAVEGTGSEANREAAWEIAEQSLTLLKNENEAVPVVLEDGQKALVLFSKSAEKRTGSVEMAKQILQQKGALPENAEITVMVSTPENEEACVQAAAEADHVILVYRTYSSSDLDPSTENGFSAGVFDRIIEERHAADRPVVFISTHLPYDAARFQEADAILLTYGASVMQEVPPASGENSAYMPNLPAAFCACFGDGRADGSLPVKIPGYEEN